MALEPLARRHTAAVQAPLAQAPQALVAPRHRTGAARAQAHTVVQAHTPAPAQAHIPAPAPALARTPAPARTRAPEAPPGGQGVRVQSKGRGQLQQNDRRVQKHKWATPRKKQNTTWELHELHQKKKKMYTVRAYVQIS